MHWLRKSASACLDTDDMRWAHHGCGGIALRHECAIFSEWIGVPISPRYQETSSNLARKLIFIHVVLSTYSWSLMTIPGNACPIPNGCIHIPNLTNLYLSPRISVSQAHSTQVSKHHAKAKAKPQNQPTLLACIHRHMPK